MIEVKKKKKHKTKKKKDQTIIPKGLKSKVIKVFMPQFSQ